MGICDCDSDFLQLPVSKSAGTDTNYLNDITDFADLKTERDIVNRAANCS